jgi:hypothetical protein
LRKRRLTEPRQNPIASRDSDIRISKNAQVESLLEEAPCDGTIVQAKVRIQLLHRCHTGEASIRSIGNVDHGLVEVRRCFGEELVIEIVVVAKGRVAATITGKVSAIH